MKPSALKQLLNNAPLKIMASILGYAFWSLASNCYTTQRWIEVPLCFYNTSSNITIKAPETISIALSGSRIAVANLDTSALAVHIDSRAMAPGNHVLNINDEHILLPRTLTLAHWSPSNLIITVEQQQLDESLHT